MRSTFTLSWVARQRQALGYSQVELAMAAGISLPTVQNIEAGKANPSWSVIQALFTTLKLEPALHSAPLDWSAIAKLGVPILDVVPSSTSKRIDPTTKNSSAIEMRRALDKWLNEPSSLNTREGEALIAFMLALHDHYPKIFARFGRILDGERLKLEVAKLDFGRLIKLRRLSLANMRVEELK